MSIENRTKRIGDRGFWCVVARRLSDLWDFIDKRDIDKHAMSWATFSVTLYIVYWSMEYAWANATKSGIEVGATIAAILLPWTPVQAKVIQWYFDARA